MAALTALLDEIDDFCGTGRKHGPFPPKPHLQDLLVAVVLEHIATRVSYADIRDELIKVSSLLAGRAAAQEAESAIG
jgi:hypothetical protein